MKIDKVDEEYLLNFGKLKCTKPLKCDSCPLFKKLKIEPDHEDYKRVLIIGEGPGNDERKAMKFFTGASGILLRSLEDDIGISEYGIGHTNTILCEGGKHLEFNDPDALYDAMDCCEENLWQEIDELNPELIVPAGNIPMGRMLPKERKGIGNCAGELYTVKDENFKVIPIHHPAHILRNPKMYPSFRDEINEIKLFFDSSDIDIKVHIGNKENLRYIKNNLPIALDFETTSFFPTDSGSFMVKDIEYLKGDIICMSLCQDGMNSYVFSKKEFLSNYEELKKLLETTGVICHNGQFDLQFLFKYNIFPRLVNDTMLMSYAMDESPSHSLKKISRRHFGFTDWSEGVKQFVQDEEVDSYAFIPEEILFPYCGMDTTTTKLLDEKLPKLMDENEKKLYDNILIPCANMFSGITKTGIRIDVSKLMELKDELANERLEIVNRLKYFGVKNCNSFVQVSEALIDCGVVDYNAVTVKSNLESFAAGCIEEGNEEGHELCNLVIGYRERTKIINTVLPDIAGAIDESDLRIHPDAKLFGTVTGRLTYGRPSLMNAPKSAKLAYRVRELYIPDKGYIWGHRDQKQFELRVYASLNDDSSMKKALADGKDPHSETGAYYYGNLDKYEKENTETRGRTRVAIKAVVFGVLYGRGIESIASQYGITIKSAAKFKGAVESLWNGLSRYKTNIKYELDTFQEIINPLGRKRRFPILTEANYHECILQANNYKVQSTANDLNLLGMYDMWSSEYYKHGLLLPLFPVHDAIEYLIKESMIDEIEEYITEMLSNIPKTILGVSDLKFATDGGLGSNWAIASLD